MTFVKEDFANRTALFWVPAGHKRGFDLSYAPSGLDVHEGPSYPDQRGFKPYDLICIDEPPVHNIDLHQVGRIGKRIFTAFTPRSRHNIAGVPKDWTVTHASTYQNRHLSAEDRRKLGLYDEQEIYGR